MSRSYSPWTQEEIDRLISLRAEGRSNADIGAALGRSASQVQNKVRDLGGAVKLPKGRRKPESTPPDPSGDRALSSKPSRLLPTIDGLLDEHKIDRSEWHIERCKVNHWEVGAVVDNVILTEPLHQLTIWLKQRQDAVLVKLREELLADLRALPNAKPIRYKRVKESNAHLLEVDAFDLHFGKLSWRHETGEDYDLKIAARCFREAIEDLIRKASGYDVEQVLFPVGNDLLQTDNLFSTTTGGTLQDTDSRYQKAFRHAVTAMIWAIRRLREVAPVVVPIIPGNHDRLAAFHVGEVLEAVFAGDKGVKVDNSPNLRKYVRYGTTLLGLTHGSEEKVADLPLIMAREEPKAWGECSVHEWHIGHLHKSKETRYIAGDTFNGVGVRVITALTAADAWHHSKGYIKARRAAEAFLWSKTAGYAGHFASQPVIS